MFQSNEDWKKEIYIAKKILPVDLDDNGNEIVKYEKPVKYSFNVQPLSSANDIQEFGQNANQMQKAVIDKEEYFNVFKEYDVAYLDGITPNDEKVNGKNANYRLLPPRNQNRVILLYFERLGNK